MAQPGTSSGCVAPLAIVLLVVLFVYFLTRPPTEEECSRPATGSSRTYDGCSTYLRE